MVAVSSKLRNRLWLLVPVVGLNIGLFMIPLAFMGVTSFSAGGEAYRTAIGSPLLVPVVLNTLEISALTTAIAIVLAYVCALFAWRSGPVIRALIFACVLLPFWTGVLVKNFAWAFLLQDTGVINHLLEFLGLINGPITILHTRAAVIVGMVHYVLPYAVLPIFAVMVGVERSLERAAASLGASAPRIAWYITLPLTLPGVYAAALLVFIISVGFFITPIVLGGPRDQMIANLVEYYARQLVDFGAASVLAIVVTITVSLLVVAYQRLPKEGQYGRL